MWGAEIIAPGLSVDRVPGSPILESYRAVYRANCAVEQSVRRNVLVLEPRDCR